MKKMSVKKKILQVDKYDDNIDLDRVDEVR